MTWKQFFLWDALVTFAGLTGYVIYDVGYVGFFELAMANWATRLMFVDLVISLALIGIWMVRDARERELSVAPFLAVGLFFGAAGPLMYLIQRVRAETTTARQAVTA